MSGEASSSPDWSVKDVLLDVLVPSDTEQLDLEQAFESLDVDGGKNSGLLRSIPRRKLMFYDEHASLYAVLRMPYVDEETLKAFLSRLDVAAEVQIAQIHPPPPPPKPSEEKEGRSQREPPSRPREVVFHTSVTESEEDPVVIVRGNDDPDDHKNPHQIYVLWKVRAFLPRPRLRFQSPVAVFRVFGTCAAGNTSTEANASAGDDYMPAFTAGSANLLESLKSDAALQGVEPRLSALRVSRVLPASPSIQQPSHQLRACPAHDIRIVPAVSSRIRYTRVNAYAERPTTIASLDFEVLPYAHCSMTLTDIDIEFPSGTITPLTTQSSLQPPISCQSRDELTFLYRLTPLPALATSSSTAVPPANAPAQTANVTTLSITLSCIANISSTCNPKLTLHWLSPVDFSLPLNPAYALPAHPLQRPNRPSSLPVSTSAVPQQQSVIEVNTTSTSFDSQLFLPSNTSPYALNSLTLTFEAPKKAVIARPFEWKVTITNRSSETQKLALLPIPIRRKGGSKSKVFRRPSPKGSDSSPTAGTATTTATTTAAGARSSVGTKRGSTNSKTAVEDAQEEDLAPATIVDTHLLAYLRVAAPPSIDLICLTPEVRVGPLYANSCHVTNLRFLPLKRGMCSVEAVRVVDLVAGGAESVDVGSGSLPEVVVCGDGEDL